MSNGGSFTALISQILLKNNNNKKANAPDGSASLLFGKTNVHD